MDKVRAFLTWLKKQHFWVLSGLIAFIGLFCWWSAAGKLTAEYDKNQKAIKTEFDALSQLQSNPFHPNELINTRQQKEIENLAGEVGKLWQQLYAKQSDRVLKWPAALSPAFRDNVEKLQFGAEIEPSLREHYQNYIVRHFPTLPEIINARAIDPDAIDGAGSGFSRAGRSELGGGVPAVGPDGQPIEDDDYICEWTPENQANIRKELEFQQQPSSLQIWVAQENLWVYRTLLEVIKNTNSGATRPSNAAVRKVYMLQVGQPAAKFSRTKGRIYMPQPPAGAIAAEAVPTEVPVDGGDPSAVPMEFSGESGLAALSSGQMSEAQQAGVLLSGRYIEATGKPIPFTGGGEAPADPTMPAPAIDTSVFGKEYKRLPVRMVLEMDQRYLPRLIAECATQPLQVEAQEVRINVPDATAGESAGPTGGGYQSGTGGSLFSVPTGVQDFPAEPHIVDVIVQGVIYIFNKPNLELLKVDEGTEPLAGTQ